MASLTGVDLCKIPSIHEISALEFISETGIDTSNLIQRIKTF